MNLRVVASQLVWALILTAAPPALAARDELSIYDLLPTRVERARATAVLAKRARVDTRLVPPGTTLLAPLQWAHPDPNRSTCDERATELITRIKTIGRVAPPESSGGLFEALLAQADQQFLYVDFHGVLQSVEDAIDVLPCTTTLVQRDQLRRLFLRRAAAEFYLDDPHAGAAFVQVLAVDPRVYLEPEYPPRVRKVYLAAAERIMAMAPRPLDTTGLPDEVYFDGIPLNNVNEVRPGKHLLQMVGPGGRLRTTLCDIDSAPGPVELASLMDVGLLDVPSVLSTLYENLLDQSLSPAIARGLQDYLDDTGTDLVAFALMREGLAVELYQSGVGLVDYDSETFSRYFRSAPPWKGLEPRRPGSQSNRPATRGLLAAARIGAGGALAGPAAWGALTEVDLYKRVKATWYPGVFGRLTYQTLSTGARYPKARFGVIVARKVPLTEHVGFLPALGYGFGKGPPTEGFCTPVSGGGAESLSCTKESDLTDGVTQPAYEAVFASSSHGPLIRLELVAGAQRTSMSWSAGLGIEGSYEFLTIHDGNMIAGDQSIPYVIDDLSIAEEVVVLNAVASFGVEF